MCLSKVKQIPALTLFHEIFVEVGFGCAHQNHSLLQCAPLLILTEGQRTAVLCYFHTIPIQVAATFCIEIPSQIYFPKKWLKLIREQYEFIEQLTVNIFIIFIFIILKNLNKYCLLNFFVFDVVAILADKIVYSDLKIPNYF